MSNTKKFPHGSPTGDYAGNPIKILRAACKTMGVELAEVLSRKRVTMRTMCLAEWIESCHRLSLDPNSIFEGYSVEEHLTRARR